MSEIDTKIAQLNKRLMDIETETDAIHDQIETLERQKSKELEDEYDIKVGEYRVLSDELRAELATRNWWTGLRHGGYDPFLVSSVSDDKMVMIKDSMGGGTRAALKLVKTCKVVKSHA